LIAVEIAGRLGNQMFAYAYALAASRRLGSGYFLIYNPETPQCFQLPEYFTCPSFNALWNRMKLSMFDVMGQPFRIVEIGSWTPPREVIAREGRWRRFRGYMQSDEFFSGYEAAIRSEFQIRPEFRKKFLERYGEPEPGRKRVAVHIRRSDYSEFGNQEIGFDLCLPVSYYERCLAQIEGLDSADVYFVGDDPEFSRTAFGNRVRFQHVCGSIIEDFQLIQSADIAVISNSTFAWWAAYLASKPSARIYAPRYWLGFKVKREYPAGVMHPNWQWTDAV
jgi:hypothetical protein